MPKQEVKEPLETLTNVANAASQVVRAESEPAPVRRYRITLFRLALVVVAGCFAGLTFLVKTIPSFGIDLQITRAIQFINFPPFAVLMRLTSWPGFTPQSVIISLMIVLVIYGSGLHWEAVMAAAAAILSTGLNILVKDLVQRPRPAAGQVNVFALLSSYSFPSGHVMYYLGFYGFIGFLFYSLLKPSITRTLILLLVGVLVVLIGFSRIYLGEHWASDVLGSYLLGSLTLAAFIQIYTWGKPRFFVHQPAAAAKPQPNLKMDPTPHSDIKR